MSTPAPAAANAAEINNGLRLAQIFQSGKRLSIKYDSYFQVYERVLSPYVGRPITFVEVGVLNGGSLFMWREYLGPLARIIGIDLNPQAMRWSAEGFEIHIGNQADPAFWVKLFQQIGPVDVLLDDGGHTNRQQIVTTLAAVKNIKDGGVLIVEDVHASYLSEFGNPSQRSFIAYAKFVVDSINRRCDVLQRTRSDIWKRVFGLEFYESMVIFRIDAPRCFVGHKVANRGATLDAVDFRQAGVSNRIYALDRSLRFLNRIILLKSIKKRVFRALYYVADKINDWRLSKHFR
jgi:hypothetical protein